MPTSQFNLDGGGMRERKRTVHNDYRCKRDQDLLHPRRTDATDSIDCTGHEGRQLDVELGEEVGERFQRIIEQFCG